MINKQVFLDFLKTNYGMEFSKEELINRFSESEVDEQILDRLLSEIEVEHTYNKNELVASCKGGTVFFKWINP
jgi:L-fucose isomerase-like protein